ncbi:MAG: histidine phosphatase family protein [Acidimicrobiales bacterium]
MATAAPITYVRHAMAVTVEGVHPTEWELDRNGVASAVALAERLEVGEGVGALVSSTEPKALGTAAAIAERWAVEVVADDRLREAARPWIGPGYRAVVHRYLRGERPEGWEAHAEVAERTAAAVAAASARADGRPVVVVSHGLALSIHLGDRLGPGFEPEQFWSSLAFPDAWALDDTGLLHRPHPRSLRS